MQVLFLNILQKDRLKYFKIINYKRLDDMTNKSVLYIVEKIIMLLFIIIFNRNASFSFIKIKISSIWNCIKCGVNFLKACCFSCQSLNHLILYLLTSWLREILTFLSYTCKEEIRMILPPSKHECFTYSTDMQFFCSYKFLVIVGERNNLEHYLWLQRYWFLECICM